MKIQVTLSPPSQYVDTYTMTFSDGTTADINITNGKNGTDGVNGKDGTDCMSVTVTKAEKTMSMGNVDMYTMFFSDDTEFSFNVSNGNEGKPGAACKDWITITSIDKTASSSLGDIYTIYYSDGTEVEWVCEAIEILKAKFLDSSSIVTAKDVGLAAKKILDNFYTYFEVTSTELGVKSTKYEVNETSGYYFSQSVFSSTMYTCHTEQIPISIGNVLKVEDEAGTEYKLKFVDVYTADRIHLTKANANGNDTTYFKTDGENSWTVIATSDGQVPATAGVSWYHTWDASTTPKFFIIVIGTTYSAPTLTASANLSEDALLATAGIGGGYINQGDSNVIISTVLGQPALTSSKNTLAAGAKLTLISDNIVINGKCMTLSADINGELVSGASVSLGTGESVKYGCFVTVTATELILQYNSSEPVLKAFTHGLKIKDYLNIVIDVSEGFADIRIMTSSGLYEVKDTEWNGRRGEVFSKSVGEDISNVTIRWYAKSLCSKIWLFGDSYFNYSTGKRWTYYLKNAGYTDNCQFGFPGMSTADALRAFKWATELGYAPKYAV